MTGKERKMTLLEKVKAAQNLKSLELVFKGFSKKMKGDFQMQRKGISLGNSRFVA